MLSPYLIFRLGMFKTDFKWGSHINWLKCEFVYHSMHHWLNINLYKGHNKEICSICWDAQGQMIASVTEDCARVWSLALPGQYLYEYQSNGKRFRSIIFHPRYRNVLLIGGYEVITQSCYADLWIGNLLLWYMFLWLLYVTNNEVIIA
jgi:WD40 repeat protein